MERRLYAITNAREDSWNIDGFIRLINNPGEDYPNAEVLLVVGTLDLVESISDLAGKTAYDRSRGRYNAQILRHQYLVRQARILD